MKEAHEQRDVEESRKLIASTVNFQSTTDRKMKGKTKLFLPFQLKQKIRCRNNIDNLAYNEQD